MRASHGGPRRPFHLGEFSMLTNIKRFALAFLVFVCLPTLAFGQATLTSTTLSAAIDSQVTRFAVASATGIAGPGLAESLGSIGSSTAANLTLLYVDKEAMEVASISSTTVTVRRGRQGTQARSHASGAKVYLGPASYFATVDPSGACTSTLLTVLPRVVVPTGNVFQCVNSGWTLIAGPSLGAQGATCGTANACSPTAVGQNLKVFSGLSAALDGASPSVAHITALSPAFTGST